MKEHCLEFASAPYHAEVAQLPPTPEGSKCGFSDPAGASDGIAHWLTAGDGVRLRAGHWRPRSRTPQGTVLLFPGRTEYLEKYGPTAEQLATRGYAVVAIDWRGQGLADRSLEERRLGHVEDFRDYQADVAALIEYARALELPQPWHLLAHSMGGAIGLRALYDGLPVAGCVFTGPMWGIRIPPLLRPLAAMLTALNAPLGLGHKRVPTTTLEQYVQVNDFDGNTLTDDPDSYAFLQMQMEQVPDLVLGGPTIQWLTQAIQECTDLAGWPSPDLPCLTFLGSDEQIVDTNAVHARMAIWPKGHLEMIAGGRHEVLMDSSNAQSRILDKMIAHFAACEQTPQDP